MSEPSLILFPAETEVTDDGVNLTLRTSDGRSTSRHVKSPFTHEELQQEVAQMAHDLERRDA